MAPLPKKHKKLVQNSELIEGLIISFAIGVILTELTLLLIPTLYHRNVDNTQQSLSEGDKANNFTKKNISLNH